MRNPDLWSRIGRAGGDEQRQIAEFARDLGVPLRFAARVADEARRYRYLSDVAKGPTAPPLPVARFLDRDADERAIDAGTNTQATAYAETRALYELEFGSAPPAEIWSRHAPAHLAARLELMSRREAPSYSMISLLTPGAIWGGLAALFVADRRSDAFEMGVFFYGIFGALAGLLTIVVLRALLRRPDALAEERRRAGLYLMADQALDRVAGGGEDSEMGDGDGSGGDGGGGD